MCTTLEWIERTDLFQDPPSKSPVHPGTVYMRLQRPVSETRPKRRNTRSFAVIRPRLAFQARSVACGGLRNVNENLATLKSI